MERAGPHGWIAAAFRRTAVLLLAAAAGQAGAQDFEPRAYGNLPVGMNFVVAGGDYTRGGLSFDAAVPITNEKLHTTSLVMGYARSLSLWAMPTVTITSLVSFPAFASSSTIRLAAAWDWAAIFPEPPWR